MNQPYVNGKGLTYKSTADCLFQTVSISNTFDIPKKSPSCYIKIGDLGKT